MRDNAKTSKIVQLGGGSITDYSSGGNQTEVCVCVCACVCLCVHACVCVCSDWKLGGGSIVVGRRTPSGAPNWALV